MKLSQLYCNDNRFHNVKFNLGVNLVLGKVFRKYDTDKDSHNLGKSTLVDLLDFMLLKEVDQYHIFRRFSGLFSGHVFYLEIILPNGKYMTIRRSVAEATKISFLTTETSIVCGDATTWDKEGLPFKSAKTYLNECLSFNVLPSWDYRKTVTFFLRSQKDYVSVFQLGKYLNGKHREWKPCVFELLGYDSHSLIEKYVLDQQIADNQAAIASISDEMSIKAEDYDRVKSSLEIKEAERDEMQKNIDAFNFYAEERTINKNLVEEIERSISELNTKEYALTYDLDKTKQSIENIPLFDMEQLKEIYAEVKVFFPEQLAHDYDDLVAFNKKVTQERNQYLREQVNQIETELRQVRESLKDLNYRRNIALSTLQDRDTFRKFKEYQKRLSVLEGEISRLSLQLSNIDRVTTLTEKSDELNLKLQQVCKEVVNSVKNQTNADTLMLKKLFNDVFRSVFAVSALLYVKPNKSSNVEFYADVAPDENAAATAEGLGNSYKKMLCASFDIAVLATYSQRSYFHFVYHDGIFEGLDNRKKTLFLQVVRDYCNRYAIQYIFSTIEDDVPADLMQTFNESEICLTLSDQNDSGKLFGFSF